jgi:hypothetical protein
MDSEEDANVTEQLQIINKNVEELIENFKSRSDIIQDLLRNFSEIMLNEQNYQNFWKNKNARSAIQGQTQSFLELCQKYDPNVIKKMEAMNELCTYLIQLIQKANDEGIRIV